ncbi:MAG: hypothetical protein WCW66_04525 [Patescibacteria group bacterium]
MAGGNPMMRYQGLLSAALKFDKVVALYLAMHTLGWKLEDTTLEFADRVWLTDAQKKSARSRNLYLVDVDFNMYRERGFGSSSGVVAHDFGINHPAPLELVALANQNNKTGELKGLPYAFALIILSMCKMGFANKNVLNQMFKVIDAHLMARGKPDPELRSDEVMAEYWRFHAHKSSWSLSGYIRNMAINGATDKEILSEVKFWREIWSKHQKARHQARLRAVEIFKKSRTFTFGNGLRGVLLETDNQDVASACFDLNLADLLVIRRRSGNISILTNKRVASRIHLEKLFESILIQERFASPNYAIKPEKIWFFVREFNSLQNWSRTGSHTPASCIHSLKIVELVQECIR